jgi:hypothetical protein
MKAGTLPPLTFTPWTDIFPFRHNITIRSSEDASTMREPNLLCGSLPAL